MQEINPSHTKQCKECKNWLPFSDFYPSKENRDRMYSKCKNCTKKYRKECVTAEAYKKYSLKYKFNITPKQYNLMLEKQGGVCASCGQPETAIDKRSKTTKLLAVDHDHKTGDVRALLCGKCNVAFGFLDEDPKRIKALLAYAEWCQTREPDTKIVQFSLFDNNGKND